MKRLSAPILLLLICLAGCAYSGADDEPVVPPQDEKSGIAEPEDPPGDEANRGESDFWNSCWGDSMEQVYEQMGGGTWLKPTALFRFAGTDVLPHLVFDEAGLLCGGYYRIIIHEPEKLAAYEAARDHLTATYGSASKEDFGAPDGGALSSIAEVAEAGGWAEAEWRPDDETVVTLKWIREGSVRVDYMATGESTGHRDKPDFENSCWGDTMEHVQENEQGAIWLLEVTSEFAGYKEVPTQFCFGKNRAGEYVMDTVFQDLTDFDMGGLTKYEKYEVARDYMKSLYGEPEKEIFYAPDHTQPASLAETVAKNGTADTAWIVMGDSGAADYFVSVTLNNLQIITSIFGNFPPR